MSQAEDPNDPAGRGKRRGALSNVRRDLTEEEIMEHPPAIRMLIDQFDQQYDELTALRAEARESRPLREQLIAAHAVIRTYTLVDILVNVCLAAAGCLGGAAFSATDNVSRVFLVAIALLLSIGGIVIKAILVVKEWK